MPAAMQTQGDNKNPGSYCLPPRNTPVQNPLFHMPNVYFTDMGVLSTFAYNCV